MSRAAGGFGISDLRSASIAQEYIYTVDPCAPGSIARHGKGGPCHEGLLNCGAPPNGFDSPKDRITILAGTIIVAIVIGLVNTFALFIPVVQREYGMGFVEVCFTAALTYAVLIKTSCVGCVVVRLVGHRLTALFGMLLVFVGIILDSQVLHYSVFYVAHIIFIGIGGGLAYCATMCLPGDLFRKMIMKGMVLISIGGSIGTILLYWFSLFLLDHISYKWTKLCLAIIVLLFTAATNLLPSYYIDQDCTGVVGPRKSQRDREIRTSVEKAAQKDKARGPKHPNEKSCLCVCVCDISLWSDWSFLLWAICAFLATMALYCPYLYIIAYADSIEVVLSPMYVTILCVASIVGRVVSLMNHDHTFKFLRAMFIGSCIISGILWILLDLTETLGWICVWCAAMGVIEGMIIGIVPRLTLVTIPRRWIDHSWGCILWFHAIGIFIVTVFVAVVGKELLDFYIAFLAIGICQIIGGIVAILLPNEEGCTFAEKLNSSPCGPSTYSSKFISRTGVPGGGVASTYKSTTTSAAASTVVKSTGVNYACNCPICSKVGCVPECPGCVPGGLSKGGMDPCTGTSIVPV